jgi:hypothetical protein
MACFTHCLVLTSEFLQHRNCPQRSIGHTTFPLFSSQRAPRTGVDGHLRYVNTAGNWKLPAYRDSARWLEQGRRDQAVPRQ